MPGHLARFVALHVGHVVDGSGYVERPVTCLTADDAQRHVLVVDSGHFRRKLIVAGNAALEIPERRPKSAGYIREVRMHGWPKLIIFHFLAFRITSRRSNKGYRSRQRQGSFYVRLVTLSAPGERSSGYCLTRRCSGQKSMSPPFESPGDGC